MAEVSGQKFWLQDHDTDMFDELPPVQNTWYEVFQDEDVRLLWCVVRQDNDDTLAKDVEVRWTIDGNEYLGAFSTENATAYFVYRWYVPSTGGTDGLSLVDGARNACYYVDKRGLDFKVEARLTGAPGTNQRLRAWCVRETLELT